MQHAHSMHTRAPRPRPCRRTPRAHAPRPRASPDSRVTFQVRSWSPQRGRPRGSADSPTPPSPAARGAGAERRSAQPAGGRERGALRRPGAAGAAARAPWQPGGASERAAGGSCGGVGAAAWLLRWGRCRGDAPGGREERREGRRKGKGGPGSAAATAWKSREPAFLKVGSPARAPPAARTFPPEASQRRQPRSALCTLHLPE